MTRRADRRRRARRRARCSPRAQRRQTASSDVAFRAADAPRRRRSACSCSARCSYDVARRRRRPALAGLPHELPVAHHPDNAGVQSAIIGHALADGDLRASSSSRSASRPRSTSRSTPTRDRWWNRADRGQHPEPRRGARRSSTASSAWRSSCAARCRLGRVVLAGGLTLGLLVLPVVIIVAREAIRAVPPSIREGSLALGATQWQTIWKQVLPGVDRRHRDRRDPRAVAGDRRDGAAARDRRRGVAALQPRRPRLERFTALPIQIFDWTPGPQTASSSTLAAGGDRRADGRPAADELASRSTCATATSRSGEEADVEERGT